MPKYNKDRFDGQADTHDRRTGIPEEQCLAVARAVLRLTEASKGDLLLDLGAGTGLPGAWFPEVGFRYVGMDASAAMLKRFAERLTSSNDVELFLTDVDQRWPVTEKSARVVWSSRAAHLFDREHLIAESERVTRPGGAFVLGRVQREQHSMRRRLRDEMRARLAARGFEPTDGSQRHARILDSFSARGASVAPPVVAAAWQARHSAAEVLRAWENTSGLGGCELEPETKKQILAELRAWAEQNLTSVDEPFTSQEQFTLEIARLRS
jgi:ubiquinone/menaquinone biosynthesis C-methylase UbiE